MRMKRTQLGRAAGATAAAIALGMTMSQTAVAIAPDPPPNTGAGAFTLTDTSPGLGIPDNSATGVSRTINVAGQGGTVRDVDVVTNIVHQFNGEVEIELAHAGKTVRFVTAKPANRAGSFAYNGTRWDDSALNIVSDAIDNSQSGTQIGLVPEGAMGAFIGSDPNGAWTLTVRDLDPMATGTLNGWTLDVRTASAPQSPVVSQTFLGSGGNIPDGTGALVQTLQVSGANPYITDLNLGTQITHGFPGDLDVTLTSPSGTRVFISNEHPGGAQGDSQIALSTTWDDSAPIDIVRATFNVATPPPPSMVPEGALGAFIGENPNGVWTITLADGTAGDTGGLQSWNLNIASTAGFPSPPVAPRPPVGPSGPVCAKVNLATTILGAKRGLRGRTAAIKVKVGNKSTAAARGAKAVFTLPGGFTLAGKQKGITVKKRKVTVTFGVINGRKAKTLTIKLKAATAAKLGVKQSPVVVTALCGSKGTKAKIKLTLAGAPR